MGSIVGQKIGYNGVGALRGQRHIPSKHYPSTPPPGGGGLRVHRYKNKLKPFSLRTIAYGNLENYIYRMMRSSHQNRDENRYISTFLTIRSSVS